MPLAFEISKPKETLFVPFRLDDARALLAHLELALATAKNSASERIIAQTRMAIERATGRSLEELAALDKRRARAKAKKRGGAR